MDDKEKNLALLRNEMENVRELYLKGFIDKVTTKMKQEICLRLQLNMEHEKI